MSAAPRDESGSTFATMVAIVAPILGFVVLASLFTPDSIRAATTVGRSEREATVEPIAGDAAGAVEMALDRLSIPDLGSDGGGLGLMVGRQYAVRLHSGNPVRYSVYRLDGLPLATRLTAAELGARFPDLDLEDVRARNVRLLMLAEPAGRFEPR